MKRRGKYEEALDEITAFATAKLMDVVKTGGVRDVSQVMGHCMEAAAAAREFGRGMEAAAAAREFGAELPDDVKALGTAALERLEHFAELAEAADNAEAESEVTEGDAIAEAMKILGI